jgi:hydroxymethylpyrimidine pyrophosphatase-like HAD family hydrolase
LLEEPSYLKEVEIDPKSDASLECKYVKTFSLEVAQTELKGACIIISRKTEYTKSEIIAVGNAGNDLTMIEYAGLGVWADNVTPNCHKATLLLMTMIMEFLR